MPVFDRRYYAGPRPTPDGVERYARDVPLGTWKDALLHIASLPREAMHKKVEQMERELEHGKVQGFPGTLFMSGRPTFTTFRPFYEVVFAL